AAPAPGGPAARAALRLGEVLATAGADERKPARASAGARRDQGQVTVGPNREIAAIRRGSDEERAAWEPQRRPLGGRSGCSHAVNGVRPLERQQLRAP